MKNSFLLLCAFLLFWALQSCEDPTNVGQSIIPDDDELEVVDLTFTDFVANTLKDDSVYTTFRSVIYLGEVTQGFFGKSAASYYTEISYPTGFEPSTNPVVDSAVLYLKNSGYSGDEAVPQTFEIFTILDTLASDSVYIASRGFAQGVKVGEFTNVVYSDEEITIGDESGIPPHLRTNIDAGLAQEMLNLMNDGTINNTKTLQEFLKGFVVKPKSDNSGKGLFTLDLNSSAAGNFSALSIYYRNSDDDTLSVDINIFPFPDGINSDNESYKGVHNHNQFVTNYAENNLDIQNQLDNYSETGYNEGYIQSGGGLVTEIRFDSLLDNLVSNSRINSAQIVIRPDIQNLSDTLFLPGRLTLFEAFERNDDGEKTGRLIGIDGRNLPNVNDDRIFDVSSTATLVKDDSGEYSYTFTLPNFIEYVKDGELEPKLYIAANDGELSTNVAYTSVSRSRSFDGIKFDISDLSESNIYMEIAYSENN